MQRWILLRLLIRGELQVGGFWHLTWRDEGQTDTTKVNPEKHDDRGNIMSILKSVLQNIIVQRSKIHSTFGVSIISF